MHELKPNTTDAGLGNGLPREEFVSDSELLETLPDELGLATSEERYDDAREILRDLEHVCQAELGLGLKETHPVLYERIVTALIKAARSSDGEVAAAALEGLHGVQDQEVLEICFELQDSPNNDVAWQATRCLAFNPESHLQGKILERVVNGDMRAATMLAGTTDPDTRQAMRDTLQKNLQNPYSPMLVIAMAVNPQAEDRALFGRYLRLQYPHLQHPCIEGLAGATDAVSQGRLMAQIRANGAQMDTQLLCIKALKGCARPETINDLCAIANDTSSWQSIRSGILDLLGAEDDPGSRQTLERFMQSPDDATRWAAARAYFSRDPALALAAFRTHSDSGIHCAAAECLAPPFAPDVREKLLTGVRNHESPFRPTYARTLAKELDADSRAAFVTVLHESETAREFAIVCAGCLKGDTDLESQKALLACLGKWEDANGVSQLVSSLKGSQHPEIISGLMEEATRRPRVAEALQGNRNLSLLKRLANLMDLGDGGSKQIAALGLKGAL
jgi:HEAT repeat protein